MSSHESRRVTLQHLSKKAAGHAVGWVNIADARALAELGLAERSRDGWRITPAGVQALAELNPGGNPSVNVVQTSAHFPARKSLT